MAASMCRHLFKAKQFRNVLCLYQKTLYSNYPGDEMDFTKEFEFEETTDFEHDDGFKPASNFASLFRHSAFAQLGDMKDKRVIGVVDTVRGDDLYIDFGAKFHCVFSRPRKNGELYKKGTKVRLLLNDMEMTSSFIGNEKHISLLEADCTLLGLQSIKLKTIQPQSGPVGTDTVVSEEGEAATTTEAEGVTTSSDTLTTVPGQASDTGKLTADILRQARVKKPKSDS